MNVGRLAWRTPTGAMLWEIWGRHKVNFLWHGAALAASCSLSTGRSMARPKCFGGPAGRGLVLSASWELTFICWFVLATSRLMPGKCKLGYPGRLLLKPVSTARLVLVPMSLAARS